MKNINGKQPVLYYGWVIVSVSFITLIIVFGIRLSFSVFFVALIKEFGWLRAQTSFIYSVSMLVFASTSTFAGIILDRWGARRSFGFGGILLALGLFLSSQAQTFWHIVLAYGVIASLGLTLFGLGLFGSLISRWFRKRRGLAIGIAFAGTGIGTLLFTPGVEVLIREFSWRSGYVILAGLALILVPLNYFFLRLNPSDLSLHIDGLLHSEEKKNISASEIKWDMQQVIQNPSFWLLVIAALGAIGPVRMLTVHHLAIITDAGFMPDFAARAIGLSGAITAFAFILFGTLSDRIDRHWIYFLGSVGLLFALAILHKIEISAPTQIWVTFYAIALGLGEGSRASLITAMTSDLFPGNALGAINGAIGAAFGLGAAFFPLLAGWLFDLQGNYSTVFIIVAASVIVSTLTLFLAPKLVQRHNN